MSDPLRSIRAALRRAGAIVPACYVLLLVVFQFGHVCELQDAGRGHGTLYASAPSHATVCPACAVEAQAGILAPPAPQPISLPAVIADSAVVASSPRSFPLWAPLPRPPPAR